MKRFNAGVLLALIFGLVAACSAEDFSAQTKKDGISKDAPSGDDVASDDGVIDEPVSVGGAFLVQQPVPQKDTDGKRAIGLRLQDTPGPDIAGKKIVSLKPSVAVESAAGNYVPDAEALGRSEAFNLVYYVQSADAAAGVASISLTGFTAEASPHVEKTNLADIFQTTAYSGKVGTLAFHAQWKHANRIQENYLDPNGFCDGVKPIRNTVEKGYAMPALYGGIDFFSYEADKTIEGIEPTGTQQPNLALECFARFRLKDQKVYTMTKGAGCYLFIVRPKTGGAPKLMIMPEAGAPAELDIRAIVDGNTCPQQ